MVATPRFRARADPLRQTDNGRRFRPANMSASLLRSAALVICALQMRSRLRRQTFVPTTPTCRRGRQVTKTFAIAQISAALKPRDDPEKEPTWFGL